MEQQINHIEDNTELEELRQQMNTVRSMLDERLLLDEKKLQKTLNLEHRDIHRFANWNLIACVFLGVLGAFMFYTALGSCSISILVAALCIGEGTYHFYLASKVNKPVISSDSLKETLENLVLLKKRFFKYKIVDYCLISPVFVIWCIYLLWTQYLDYGKYCPSMSLGGFIAFMMVALIIGLFIDYFIYSRQWRNINRMLDTLEEEMDERN